ncbi:MAG: amino acid deaminase [Alphaproteobacteria bacterium]|nr:amino acid deaminase [Alphaproteobacteria bacterium]
MSFPEIDGLMLDGRVKGMPSGATDFALGRIGERRWNVLREDLPLPLAILRQSALRQNAQWMRGFLEHSGAVIAPHGKTTMSPQLFRQQMADGAWAMTVATTQQLRICRDFGFERIVLANQLVGRQAIGYVLAEMKRDPAFDFYCLVDGVANVEQLAAAAREAAPGRPLQLLLEGGMAAGRTGCRDLEEALKVARAVRAAGPLLALRGVEGFEGLIHSDDPAADADAVRRFLDFLVAIALACAREGLFAEGRLILSAGGSAFYDLVVERFRNAGLDREFLLLTRSGCYLTHDSKMYREAFAQIRERAPGLGNLGPGLVPAFEVWAYVQSRPEPLKAILTMGKRDVSYDVDLPVPLKWVRPSAAAAVGEIQEIGPGHIVTGLNDQHCHMSLPAASPLAVGDMVAFGVSHPCTTFDKWQVIPVVDDDYTIVSAIKTFF